MKKLVLFIILSCLLATGISAETCDYDEEYDDDGDYVMNKQADCSSSYQYDCDDSNKDTYKDCENSLWKRIKAFFTRGKDKVKDSTKITSKITSSAIKKIVPDTLPLIGKTSAEEKAIEAECYATICLDNNLKDVYCPLDYEDCCEKFSSCKVVYCAEEFCEQEEYDTYEDTSTSTTSATSSNSCSAEYHDCYDDGEAVLCKGDFDQCDDAFDDCTCGTGDNVADYAQAKPDIDSSQAVECSTGVFVCDRQMITMSGDLASSTVTCKSSFQACSVLYGNCRCGNSTLTDFPTQYIGSTGVTAGSRNADNYWCDFKGKQIPCHMMPGNCTKKKNTCNKGGDIWIGCDGTIEFCNKKYNNDCLCGVEILSSGFMRTSG
jgi:hypothetical protein